jgi:pimeloyl-ACP methyl ester carboxylesterase
VKHPGVGELDVVLLHGVGLAPCTFDPLMDALRHALPDLRAPLRLAYRDGSRPAAYTSVEDEAGDLVRREVDGRADPARPCAVVGVSGGATLALALAAIGHPAVVAVVAHEPLVGPLAPELHQVVTASADLLAAGDDEPAVRATAFVRRLVGDAVWHDLPRELRAFTADHAVAVIDEVPRFAAFAPGEAALRAAATTVTVTTGGASHARRHQVADVLGDRGLHTATVEGATHLASWEAPGAFARVVRAALDRSAA